MYARMRSSLVVLAVLGATLLNPQRCGAYHHIPVFAFDWDNDLFTTTGVSNYPELTDLIEELAPIYHEDMRKPGDAEFIDAPVTTMYFGFGNINYRGVSSAFDPDNEIQYNERCFYHSTDPSGLVAWRTLAGIELRWNWDSRAIRVDSLDIDIPMSSRGKFVEEYRVFRGLSPNDMQYYDTVVRSGADAATFTRYLDTGAVASTEYCYSIRSVVPGTPVQNNFLNEV